MPTSMTNYAIPRTCRRLGQHVFFQAGAGVKTPARSPGTLYHSQSLFSQSGSAEQNCKTTAAELAIAYDTTVLLTISNTLSGALEIFRRPSLHTN